ncbi:AAA family ATPase [Patescibacteria group bacterium]|nr:AAA family ATPase [Patescibacteria group bacterium]
MHLKRIEISGFKSFAQKTTLEFEKEISAIVGPNGSGKSNVADAVRWAIGEQSAKALRVKKSENLIFSSHTAGAGKASVSLYFDNRDHALPVDFDEIVISRRLYKNGDTQYFINESKVRLLDILEMLSRVGINPKSYCVVSQGMADAILRASAEERRGIFEDAAGVKPYKIKRNEALRKLELTEENLSRASDLLAEIKPRLAFLRRQALKAEKIVVVKKELDEGLKKWYAFTLNRFSDQKKTITENLDGKDSILKKAQDELNSLIKKMDEIKASSGNLDDRQENLRNDLENVQIKIDECIKNLAIYETRLKIEEEREERPSIEAVAISIDYIKGKIADIYSAISAVAELIKKSKDGKPAVETDIENIEAKTRELLSDIASGKAPVDKNRIRQRAEEKAKAVEALSGEIARIKNIFNELNSEKENIRHNINKEVSGDRVRRGEFFALQGEINRAESAVYKMRNEKQIIIIEETKINTRVEDLINEIKTEMGETFLIEVKKVFPEAINEYELKEKIEKLKREYIQIGGIDPMVINECKETNERYNFLAKESGDLEQAIGDLRKVIARLDEKIDAQFNSIFKKINFEFNKYFRLIFGGGGASLELFEIVPRESEENADAIANLGDEEKKSKKKEKGINVKVSIPGKKVKDLETLSGGERSLTSSAILFAIIASNPPPFIVLDEIDAALDENNSQKIALILSELGNISQFIVITHNRAIMRQAKTIYGVSMTDESISKIISVKIDEVK